MKKIELNMEENKRYEAIKLLVDKRGNKKRLAIELGITIRQVNRLIVGYKEYGKEFFIHGNKGRKPKNAIDEKTKELIKNLYFMKYFGANFKHYSELLEKYEDIKVSSKTIRTVFKEDFILSPKARRITKRNIKKELEQLKERTTAKKQLDIIQDKIVDAEDAPHPRRSRCKYFGEMLQMDASLHNWFGDEDTNLHIAVDDHSGIITGAYFDYQETLNGYYNILYQVLNKYGIPIMFFTDRRTVFEYKKKASSLLEEDTSTQFGYACQQLGIEIKTSSIPEAKGRVERMFKTLQSRLPIELRIANITDIAEANQFLRTYIEEFNATFALPIKHSKSVFEKQPDDENINLILAVLSKRKVDSGHSIQYNKKYYKFLDSNGVPVYYHKGTECIVIRAFDKQLFASIGDNIYALEEIPKHQSMSKEFDFEQPNHKQKKTYIPSMNHPWRKQSFNNYFKRTSPCSSESNLTFE